MGDIETLVGQSRDAGMVVEFAVQGVSRAYAPEVEQTAYRVVQEALTNVHKHAAGSKVMVRLAHREAEIAMQVENGPSYGAADAGLPSGGNGLVGMRERVHALGGVFVSGETDAGVSGSRRCCRTGPPRRAVPYGGAQSDVSRCGCAPVTSAARAWSMCGPRNQSPVWSME